MKDSRGSQGKAIHEMSITTTRIYIFTSLLYPEDKIDFFAWKTIAICKSKKKLASILLPPSLFARYSFNHNNTEEVNEIVILVSV